eukprot:c2773_g1_i1 orf=1-579(-)
MLNLLSRSFSAHGSRGTPMRDIVDLEAGPLTDMMGVEKLNDFFEEVGFVKSQIQSIKLLLYKLQDENEKRKTITRRLAVQDLSAAMDKNAEEVLQKAKFVRGRLEEMDKANIASRKIPGSEEGTSADRIRTCLTNSLRKKFRDIMGDFQHLRQKMLTDYRESISRRFYALTGTYADEETLDKMISTGESETFV